MRIITELFNNTKLCWESFAKFVCDLCLWSLISDLWSDLSFLRGEERGEPTDDCDHCETRAGRHHYRPAAHWLRLHHLLLLGLLQALHHLVDVDGLVVLLDHLPRRQAGAVAGVPGAETDRDLCWESERPWWEGCQSYPHDIDNVLGADGSVIFIIGPAPWWDCRGPGTPATDCWNINRMWECQEIRK